MSILITIDNDPNTAGIQPLVEDESAGVQTPNTADTGNDVLVTLTNPVGGALGGLQATFNTALNGTLLDGFVLTDAQKVFAATNDGASSATSFVTVTTTGGETVSNLFFSDASGAPLSGAQVAGMQTLDGQNVFLWSNGDFAIATTSAILGQGRIVAAFYLNEAANHLSAQVQMVTFEALKHPVAGSTAASYDDALNFTDALQVSAAGTLSFNFDNLPSGNFLYAAVGTTAAGVLVTGQDLNVQAAGTGKAGDIILGGSDPSDTVNTSQGGQGATIGIDSQMFAAGKSTDGPVGVFTLAKGFTSFDGTFNGSSEGTGNNITEINYSDYIDAPSASIFISQISGSTASFRLSLWEAGGGATYPNAAADHAPNQLTPETSYNYLGDHTTDSNLRDDTPVNVATISVTRGGTTYVWGTGGMAFGVTQSGITVSLDAAHHNTVSFTGVNALDTINFRAANDPANPNDGTFNRFEIQGLAGTSGFDIGRIDLAEGVSVSQGVGSDLVVQDSGPSLDVTSSNAPALTVDESNFAVDNTKSFSGQFTPHYGADGPAGTPVTYALSTPGGASGLVDTLTGQSVVLSKNAVTGAIEGSTATSHDLVFVISVDSAGNVTLDGKRAVVHSPDTGPDQSTGLTGSNLVVLTATAHDGDGDTAAQPLDLTALLNFKDDAPTLDVTSSNAPSLTVDESNFAVDNTKSFSGQFTPHYGADGPAGTPVTYALSTPGGASGLVDTLTGQSVVLSKNAVTGAIEGSTATSHDLVFVISVDSSGNVTLDGRRAVVHSPDTGPDQSTGLTGSNLVVLTATARDGDGDTAAQPLDLTALLNFKDDAPTLDVTSSNAPSLTVDESNFAVDNTKSFAAQFTPHYGADGPAGTPVTYALSTPGGNSGLVDTLTGQTVVLSKNAVTGNIEGSTATSHDLVFVISVDSAGNVTLDGRRAVVHSPDTGPDQSTGLTGSNLVVLTATARDGDGDTAAQPLDLTALLNFKDDAPTLDVTSSNAPSLTVDESNFAVDNTKSFAAQFTPHYGADGPAGTPVTYALSTPGGNSGLVDTLTGQTVVLSKNAVTGNIEGSTATSHDLVFVISVDSAGNVTLDGRRAVVHSPDTGPDQSTGLTGSNLVVLTATARDGDGDTAAQPLDLTALLNFKDDAPTIVANANTPPSITDDESFLTVNNSASYAADFTPTYGADGPAGTPVTYGIAGTSGADSGLIESGTGNHVFLFNESGVVVGRAGTSAATAMTVGDIVFTVSIDGTGTVTLDQRLGVVHNPNTGVDQSTTLASAGLVTVTATAHDGDGDTASAPLNIGTLLNFKDDAPTITAQILGGTVAFAIDATGTVSHSLNGAVGADVDNATQQSLSGVKEYTITSWSTPTNVFAGLNAVLSADGTTLTYYSDVADTNAVYRLSLNQTANSGAGSYTFTVLQTPPITQTHFDFTDLPSGQNLFGVIATDKADLSKGGLLVTPTNPVLAADGTMTNTSGTINTSKGGGPVTIGNANQAFDDPKEGAWFMFVDNPQATAVGGLQLTQTTADDADTVKFNGVNQAIDASVQIVQASGMGTANKPGPAMHITAYEANPGNVSTDALSRPLVNDPTAAAANQGTAAPEVNIVGVKIHDATGKVIEYRTVNQGAGASNTGALHDVTGDGLVTGADDSAVGIQFVLDNLQGAGTPDDIYSTVISNLKANYTIEYLTATNHDLAKVQNVSGSYDIGGFNAFTNNNVPAQHFDFSVQINDYDNDAFGGALQPFAKFSVDLSGLVF